MLTFFFLAWCEFNEGFRPDPQSENIFFNPLKPLGYYSTHHSFPAAGESLSTLSRLKHLQMIRQFKVYTAEDRVGVC